MEIKLYKGRKYSFCSCGLSKTLPLCDNAHRLYNQKNKTNYKSIKIISTESTRINISSSTWKKIDN
ncbi:MAG: hypothetical protein CMD25_07725 [Flavobacteriales bacterium]|nr:hypothetical protein [Flavobacteriales bacterium]